MWFIIHILSQPFEAELVLMSSLRMLKYQGGGKLVSDTNPTCSVLILASSSHSENLGGTAWAKVLYIDISLMSLGQAPWTHLCTLLSRYHSSQGVQDHVSIMSKLRSRLFLAPTSSQQKALTG